MKTSREEIDFLIRTYIENKCTPHEKSRLFDLLSSESNEKLFTEALTQHLNEFRDHQFEGDQAEFDRIFKELISEINLRESDLNEKSPINKKIVRRLVVSVISLAATFIFAFYTGVLFSRSQNIPVVNSVTSVFTEVRAPLGARSEVKLVDGTEIILNAGSSIKYRSDYNFSNRDLFLEGEAYFKVATDSALPLIVLVGNISIKATGTEFNVKAYTDENIIETTLVEGEVEIMTQNESDSHKPLILEPNQKAIFARLSDKPTLEKIREIGPLAIEPAKIINDKLLVASKTDVEQVTAWTKNKLIIRSEDLESLCAKLQRKYNVNFEFRDEEIKRYRFTGTLLDETFQQVMDVIMLTAHVDYKLDGKTVLLFPRKNP